MDEDPPYLDALPEMLRTITEAAALEAALAITRAFGGREVYIPCNPKPDSRLARLVGMDPARRIAAAIGHGNLRIPHGPGEEMRAARRRAEFIYDVLTAHGANVSEIAHATGFDRRTIERRRARERKRERQRSLF